MLLVFVNFSEGSFNIIYSLNGKKGKKKEHWGTFSDWLFQKWCGNQHKSVIGFQNCSFTWNSSLCKLGSWEVYIDIMLNST